MDRTHRQHRASLPAPKPDAERTGSGRRGITPDLMALRLSLHGVAVSGLQHSIGNRAVQRLLAVQREPTDQQKKEFAQYVTGEDWGRAAWVLNEWSPPDIAARIKTMRASDLELLNQGAWFAGKNNVDAAVRARNAEAAARGALRVLISSKRWDEAAKQLEVLGRAAALKYVGGLKANGTITGPEFRTLMKIAPVLGLMRGDTMTVGDKVYTVYATRVRFGGDPVWRYNNPGALKQPNKDIPSWGYIGHDPQWFLIFPDMATGQRAAVANLAHQATAAGNRSILQTMENYANMPGDRPDLYADNIVAALAGTGPPKATRDTPFGSLTPAQRDIVKETIFNTEKGKTGDEVPYDSPELPEEVRERLRN
jgi:hypothetical protein